jgi:hypothetical protein
VSVNGYFYQMSLEVIALFWAGIEALAKADATSGSADHRPRNPIDDRG